MTVLCSVSCQKCLSPSDLQTAHFPYASCKWYNPGPRDQTPASFLSREASLGSRTEAFQRTYPVDPALARPSSQNFRRFLPVHLVVLLSLEWNWPLAAALGRKAIVVKAKRWHILQTHHRKNQWFATHHKLRNLSHRSSQLLELISLQEKALAFSLRLSSLLRKALRNSPVCTRMSNHKRSLQKF